MREIMTDSTKNISAELMPKVFLQGRNWFILPTFVHKPSCCWLRANAIFPRSYKRCYNKCTLNYLEPREEEGEAETVKCQLEIFPSKCCSH